MSGGIVGFMGTIWQTLGEAHYSPLLRDRVYVFDSRYDLYIPDREQVGSFMGVILLSGVFVIAEGYEYTQRLESKLRRAGVNCRVEPLSPPDPFGDKIK